MVFRNGMHVSYVGASYVGQCGTIILHTKSIYYSEPVLRP